MCRTWRRKTIPTIIHTVSVSLDSSTRYTSVLELGTVPRSSTRICLQVLRPWDSYNVRLSYGDRLAEQIRQTFDRVWLCMHVLEIPWMLVLGRKSIHPFQDALISVSQSIPTKFMKIQEWINHLKNQAHSIDKRTWMACLAAVYDAEFGTEIKPAELDVTATWPRPLQCRT